MLLALQLLNLLEEEGEAPADGDIIVFGSLYLRDFSLRL